MSDRFPGITAPEIRAVKELWDTHNGQLLLKMLVEKICMVDAPSFDPDNPHKTAYREGQRQPGMVIRDMITLPMKSLIGEPDVARSTDSKSVRSRSATRQQRKRPASTA